MRWIACARAQLKRATDALFPPRIATREPASDALLVRAPTGGECWHWVERRQISWRITGGLGHPCCVLLERRTEQGKWSEAAVLASQVDPRALRASVVVPELPEGPYRVRITSPELPYDACSPPLIISHNGTVDLPATSR
ncbi:hypothetical protein [Streptomyces agglomeratus]|uniref:hypothetical protein n=1 Tax=Streptomyces agglomeratus TaxID=285458 RepID=UPI00114C85E5|nr:hypothetical protein [Streptomyces agglomeratus]